MLDLGFAVCTDRPLDMLDSLDKQRLHKLLSDTIPVLCKNTLGCSLELSVEGFIGITLSGENASEEVVMVSFKETLLADGRASSYIWSEVPSSSPGSPPPLIEPVALNISESGKAERSPPAVDSIDGNAIGLERHGEYSPKWVGGRYWADCNEAAVNSVVPVVSHDGAKDAIGTSASSHPLALSVKDEENDDFETDADFDSTCDTGNSYENRYTSIAGHYSPLPCSYRNVNACHHYLSSTGRRVPHSSRGSRKVVSQPSAARSLSVQHLMSSSYSRQRAKMKKAAFQAMNASMYSSHSEVCKVHA